MTFTPVRSVRLPRYRFVGGKGGVGKTTCAAALALAAADAGRRTLVISTDPAPSLGDALGQRLGPHPARIRGAPGLWALEIDAPAALRRWIEQRRAALEGIALRGTWLDQEDVQRLLRLSLPGIDEIAALFEIADRGNDPAYEHIVVDTAPTGHLLRMFEMPAVLAGIAHAFDRMQAKHRVLVQALRGGWAPDAADALIDEMRAQAAELRTLLRDRAQAGLSWVTLAETMAVAETGDALESLQQQGVAADGIIVNRLTAPPPQRCAWCSARRRTEREAVRTLRRLPAARALPMRVLEALEAEPRGLPALRAAGRMLSRAAPRPALPGPAKIRPLQPMLPVQGATGPPASPRVLEGALLMFGGKGGVGKTTCAAAAALTIAAAFPHRRILLLSVDPAHSLGDVLARRLSDAGSRLGDGPRNLVLRELDAARAFATMRARFDAAIEQLFEKLGAAGAIDSGDGAVMRDLLDLAPPGLDEIAAVMEVTDTLQPGERPAAFDLLVMDTAPTGHALRLIETPALVHDWVKAVMAILLKYQVAVGLGDLASMLVQLSKGLGRLRSLMTDPQRTRFVAVTRAAALPRAETLRLLERLASAHVAVPVLIVNAVGAGTCSRCARDRAAQEQEIARLQAITRRAEHRQLRLWLAPALMPPPVGADALSRWAESWTTAGTRLPAMDRRGAGTRRRATGPRRAETRRTAARRGR